jgi:hypothetical protein
MSAGNLAVNLVEGWAVCLGASMVDYEVVKMVACWDAPKAALMDLKKVDLTADSSAD